MWFKFRRWDYKVKRMGWINWDRAVMGCFNIRQGVRGNDVGLGKYTWEWCRTLGQCLLTRSLMKFQLIYLISDILLNLLSQGSDGKCYNIPQGVRGRPSNGKSDLQPERPCGNIRRRPSTVSLVVLISLVYNYLRTYVRMYVCMYACVRACVRTHARMHTYIHTYIHSHTTTVWLSTPCYGRL